MFPIPAVKEQSTNSSTKMERTSFKVHNGYEPLERSELHSGLFHSENLHKATNEGRRGVLPGSSSDD